jgi:hypothetical protein
LPALTDRTNGLLQHRQNVENYFLGNCLAATARKPCLIAETACISRIIACRRSR